MNQPVDETKMSRRDLLAQSGWMSAGLLFAAAVLVWAWKYVFWVAAIAVAFWAGDEIQTWLERRKLSASTRP